MARIPDLVRDSELRAHFDQKHTVQTYHEPDSTSRRRLVVRTEYWKQQKRIGGGSCGSVWLEQCIQGGKDNCSVRAVKQIFMGRHSQPIDYVRELEAIAKFSHPKYESYFVKSFGWYNDSEHLFITMEYLELGDLATYVHGRPALPENEAKQITYQLLEALGMMHQNEFAHRDLKPGNILIKSYPPEDWWIKLADFGISKRVEKVPASTLLLKGTEGYIAPELYGYIPRGSEYATDMWATGEIAFQLLTKQPTFDHVQSLADYAANRRQFPTDTLLNAHVSQSGVDFVLAVMKLSPTDRLSAKDALSHRWIESCTSDSPSLSHPLSDLKPESLPTASEISPSLSTVDPRSSLGIRNSAYSRGPSPISEDLIRNIDQREVTTIPSSDNTMRRRLAVDFHGGTVRAIAFSPDSRVLAITTDQSYIALWNIEKGVEIPLAPKIRQASIDSRFETIAVSAKGRHLATGTDRGRICVWDVPTGSIIMEKDFSLAPPGVTNCAFDFKSRHAVFTLSNGWIATAYIMKDKLGEVGVDIRTISTGDRVDISDPTSNSKKPGFEDSSHIKALVALHCEHGYDDDDCDDVTGFVYTSGKHIWVQESFPYVNSDVAGYKFSSTERPVVLSADGMYMAYFAADKKIINVYETSNKSLVGGINLLYTQGRHKVYPKLVNMAISGKAKLLAAYIHYKIYDPLPSSLIGTRYQIVLWNLETGEELNRFPRIGTADFLPMEFSPDGALFICGLLGSWFEIWTLDDGLYFDILENGDNELSAQDDLQEQLD